MATDSENKRPSPDSRAERSGGASPEPDEAPASRAGRPRSGARNRDRGRPRGRSGNRGGDRRRAKEKRPVEVPDGPLVLMVFRGGRLEPFVNARGLVVRRGDYVLVEAERGMDLGWVAAYDNPQIQPRKGQAVRELLRHATVEEVARLDVLAEEDRGALEICRGRAAHFSLEMKIIDAETQFDGNRVTFYFTAERRVDFRELVRDLAGIFRTRIELRQVGARDAARRCDGVGPCGRQLCCTTFLSEFEPVTLKMAKEQNLSLNPAKISGACGRLMCCLVYECAAYREAVGLVPELGSRWRYLDQAWTVCGHDVGNNRIFLEGAEGASRAVDIDSFRREARPAVAAPPPTPQDPGRA